MTSGINKTEIEWAKIPGWPDYYACREGFIASTKKGRLKVMKPMEGEDGHTHVILYKDGKGKKQYVHRLILITFRRKPKPKEESRHINGVPHDNRIENLEWGSKSDNQLDRITHGTSNRGERSGSAKLTENQVLEIRERVGGESLRTLAKEYGVSHTAIRRAANGMKWSHL